MISEDAVYCVAFFDIGVDINPASQDLVVVAMALSGFTGFVNDGKNSLWFEQCRTLSAKLANPYLRAMFLFLTVPDGDSYDNILVRLLIQLLRLSVLYCSL